MAKSNDIDNDIDEMIQEFEERRNRVILHSVLFYWQPTVRCKRNSNTCALYVIVVIDGIKINAIAAYRNDR